MVPKLIHVNERNFLSHHIQPMASFFFFSNLHNLAQLFEWSHSAKAHLHNIQRLVWAKLWQMWDKCGANMQQMWRKNCRRLLHITLGLPKLVLSQLPHYSCSPPPPIAPSSTCKQLSWGDTVVVQHWPSRCTSQTFASWTPPPYSPTPATPKIKQHESGTNSHMGPKFGLGWGVYNASYHKLELDW